MEIAHRIDYVLEVSRPTEWEEGWHYTVLDQLHGPFETEAAAYDHRFVLFQRWNQHARERGGWMWVSGITTWCVVLPDDVPCPLDRMRSDPCTRHEAED